VDVYCADNEEDKNPGRRMFIRKLFVGVSRRGNCGEGGDIMVEGGNKKTGGEG